MAFCPNCGSQADGSFCPKCGAALGATPGGAPMGGMPTGGVPMGGPAAPAGTSGMTDNVAGALCYLVGFITGIIFLVMEPYNKRPFVRYHAWQSIIFSVGWFIFSLALNIVFAGLALAGMVVLGASALGASAQPVPSPSPSPSSTPTMQP